MQIYRLVNRLPLPNSTPPNASVQEQMWDRDNAIGEFIQETLALTKRLFIQLKRRPTTFMAGIMQP